MSEAAHPIAVTSGRLRLLKALALIIMLISLAHDGLFVLGGLPINTGLSRPGFSASSSVDGGYTQIERVTPDGAAAAAGVQSGDWVRFDRPMDVFRTRLPPGEQLGLTIRTGDQLRRTTLTVPAKQTLLLRWETVIGGLANILLALAGGLIALRSPRLSGVVLGGAMASMALVGTYTLLWENHPALVGPLSALYSLIMTSSPILLIAFAVLMRREAFGRSVSPVGKVVLAGYAGIQVLMMAAQLYVTFAFTRLPLLGDAFLVGILVQWAGFLVALILLAMGWREATGAERTRFGFLFVALAQLFMAGHGTGLLINLTGNDFSLRNPVALAGQLCMAGGIAAFLYASLRHKVVDMGFAVNRTLVFGILSSTLLFAFFFLEWGAEQIIPASMKQASLLASAGIAFGLFLVFERVRGWVERSVETLFFRRWRDSEAELRRFVRQAAFVTRSDALRQASVAAFRRFADGADVALYGATAGDYRIEAGGLPGLKASLDPDLDMLVRLRAEREALEDGLSPGVALALPLLNRNEVTGVFALAPKPSGELYRPDEVSALAEAALRIGLDLHALSIEALQAESDEQRRRAELLERQMQNLLKTGAPA